ncbi:MAG TPA: flagellar basal body-associated FliL family protein [Spongiibacteraceae bacterium]|jgi:flagellar FliL protein
MADTEDLEEDAEASEEDAAQAAEAAARKKKLLLLGAVGVVLLLVAGGGTWFALRMLSGDKAKPVEAVSAEPARPAVAAGEKKEEKKEEKSELKPAFYDLLDPAFLANYSVAGRQHYLQLSLAVMAREQSGIDALHTHMPLVRNRVVLLLSGEVFEQLQTDDGRVQLQQKLLKAMQEILTKETGKPGIEQVFFINFVMQ